MSCHKPLDSKGDEILITDHVFIAYPHEESYRVVAIEPFKRNPAEFWIKIDVDVAKMPQWFFDTACRVDLSKRPR